MNTTSLSDDALDALLSDFFKGQMKKSNVGTVLAYLVWVERKVLAHIQLRVGPNRVGPHGLLQPLSDLIKLMFKEGVIPSHVNKPIYLAAPFLAVMTFAAVARMRGALHAVTLQHMWRSAARRPAIDGDLTRGAPHSVDVNARGRSGIARAESDFAAAAAIWHPRRGSPSGLLRGFPAA